MLELRPEVVPFFIGVGLYAYLLVAGYRYRQTKMGIEFILIMGAACLWQISSSLSILSTSLWFIKILTIINVACMTSIPVLVILFTAHLTRRQWMTKPGTIVLLCFLPFMSIVLTATNDLHHLVYANFRFQELSTGFYLSPNYGVWYTIFDTYSYLLILIVIITLIEWYQKAAPIGKGHTIIIWLGMIPPMLANVLFKADFIQTPIDPTSLAFSITGLVILWGLLRYGLPDVIPIAREIIFESIRDGVIVLDNRDFIIDINPTAARIFGGNQKHLIGKRLLSLISQVNGSLLMVKTDAGETETLHLEASDQLTDYEIRSSPVCDKNGLVEGKVILLSDITERRKMEDELRILSSKDHLTGLINRRTFFLELAKQIQLAKRYKYQLTVCMMDLDRFKLLNDQYGHQVGDDALAQSCLAIQNTIRSSDMLARYGGDELAMLLVHTGERGALTLCKRISAVVASLVVKNKFKMGISIGITSMQKDDTDTGETIIARADRALYKAKAHGRGGIVVL